MSLPCASDVGRYYLMIAWNCALPVSEPRACAARLLILRERLRELKPQA